MKQFFNIDNIIFRGIGKWVDYIYVSILWFVFSVPLITMGAATAALYHTCSRCLRYDRGYIFKEFWKCFKNNFRQSAVVTVILCVLLGAIHLDMRLLNGNEYMKVIQILLIAARLLILMVSVYIFPYITKYEMKTVLIIKNCIYISILNFPWTILLVLILSAAICLVILVPGAVLMIPSCAGMFFSLILERIFDKYASQKGREDI